MTSSWKTRECHFTWNLEGNPTVYKVADKLLSQIKSNLAETDFLKIEHLLFRACLQSWFKHKESVKGARESLDEAKQEIEHRKSKDVYKGLKSVELLNRMWIENNLSNNERVCELYKELETMELEKQDLQVVGAIRAAALMRLGPVMIDTNLKLFKAAHQACPSNPDFLFGVAHITGKKMRFKRTLASRYDKMEKIGQDLMDEEKMYWENLIAMKLNDRRSHLAKSMLGLNLSRRDGPDDRRNALRLLEEAHNDAPDIPSLFNNLIRSLRYKYGDLDRCVKMLESCISNSTGAEIHHQLALCYIDHAKKGWGAADWNIKALEELEKCLQLDDSHVYALLQRAKQLQYVRQRDMPNPQDVYEDMIQKSKFTPDDKVTLYSNFACFLHKNESASRYSSRFDMWQEVMNMTTNKTFEYQNDITGRWETTQKVRFYKTKAYEGIKKHYESEKHHLQLGILFYQNFEFDDAIKTLTTVEQANAEVPYYLAKTYLKRGQEKMAGDPPKPEEAAEDFLRARESVDLVKELDLDPQKIREILADTALAIAHNELQVNVRYGGDHEDHYSIIALEGRCVTSYREAVKCGSLVSSLELLKLVKRDFIKFTSRSKFIQMLAEIEVCCSQPQSDMLHAESKPLTFEKGPRSQETDVEPSMLSKLTKIKTDIKKILSKVEFYQEAWNEVFYMEVQLLRESFKVTIEGKDKLQLDGREDVPLEDVNEEIKTKAVDCCLKTRYLLDHIMYKFQTDELGMDVLGNYFPLLINDEELTQEAVDGKLRKKYKKLTTIKTHYPDLYAYILKLQPNISAENYFLKTLFTVANDKKHTDKNVLSIEPNPVKLARQSTDKVEEICSVFFNTMEETMRMRTRVEELVSAIRQGDREAVDEADELFKLLENEVFVVKMNNTWKFLEMLALIRHCREAADTDLTEVTELSEWNSEFSKELRKCYLEVEAALLANGGNQSSTEVLQKCRTTCEEVENLLITSLQSEGNQDTKFPFHNMKPNVNKSPWKGKVNQKLQKDLRTRKISDNRGLLLNILLKAQPCSNEDNYHFIAMREFLQNCKSTGNVQNMVSITINGETNESYDDVLELTRWCVNHAEKLASAVLAEVQRASTPKKAKGKK